jgi:hypothetical protein
LRKEPSPLNRNTARSQGFGTARSYFFTANPNPIVSIHSYPAVPSRLDPVNPSKLLGPLGKNTFKSIKYLFLLFFLT